VLNNPNATTTLTNLLFIDTLSGLVVAGPNGVTNTCGGTVVAVPGAPLITLINSTLAPGASCTLTVNVTATSPAAGLITNSTGALTSNEAPAGLAATATLFIGDPFQLTYVPNLNVGDSVV